MDRRLVEAINRLVRPVQNGLQAMIRRAVLTALDDTTKLQVAQIAIGDETRNLCERFQQYGFTSVPQVGAEAIVLFLGGQCSHPIVIAVDDRRYRLTGLEAGEVAIYSDEGDQVVIKRGGNIRVAASTKVEIVSPEVTISGDLGVDGTITAGGDVVAGSIHLKTHKHTGVASGVALSGTPV